MAFEPLDALFRARSRELALVCDAMGSVTWLDDRAQRLLRASPGARLFDLAAPNCFEAVDRFPVVVHTSQDLGRSEHERLAARVAAVHSKQSLSREVAIARVHEVRVDAGRRLGSRQQGS